MDNITIENYKKIGLFMGYVEPTIEQKIKWVGCHTVERLNQLNPTYIPFLIKDGNNNEPLFMDSIYYENDYHYLMLVIERIESLGFITNINTDYISFKQNGETILSVDNTENNKKLMIYNGILTFIDWYNTNK